VHALKKNLAQHQHKVRGFAEFLETTQVSVIPKPFYAGDQGCRHGLDLIEEAVNGLSTRAMKKVHL